MVKAAMLTRAALVLAFVQDIAATSTTECDASEAMEESALLQHASSSSPRGHGPGHHGCPCKSAVYAVQEEWKNAILSISEAYLKGGDFVKKASDAIDELYGYDIGRVMFKPTKAVEVPFRPTFMGALSYFVGYDAIKPEGIMEDTGFAINGGEGWSKVVFVNDEVSCMGDVALAHGYYYFTNAKTGSEVGVEYSFVYKRSLLKHKLKIILHHSSVPFPAPASLVDVERHED